jgi:hypothetical protein
LFCWYWWPSLYSMVWDKRWLLVLLILVIITVFNGMRQEVITCFVDKTSNHLLSHTIEYSDGHQYQQTK